MATSTDDVNDPLDESGEDDESEGEEEKSEPLSPETLSKKAVWEREQAQLKSQLIVSDSPDVRSWRLGQDLFAGLNYIGGVDISFVKGTNKACAMMVILNYPDLKVVHVSKAIVEMVEPYIPGFLAFREVGFLMDRLEEIKQEKPEYLPQVILVDGNGILHPRGLGLASHLGVLSGIPSIGVAKTLFHVDGLEKTSDFKDKVTKLGKKGDWIDLKGNSGKLLGRALRASDGAPNPVYISVGHKISLDTSTKLAIACSLKRIPEPTRQADLMSREELRPKTNKTRKK
jgi:deoxyinosine 3'endonuclease (endonuclease V)